MDISREVVSPKVGQNIGIYRYIIVFCAKFEWIKHFVHFFVLSAHCAAPRPKERDRRFRVWRGARQRLSIYRILGPSRFFSLYCATTRSLSLSLAITRSLSLSRAIARSLSLPNAITRSLLLFVALLRTLSLSFAISRYHLLAPLALFLALSLPLAITRSLSLTSFFMTIAYSLNLFSLIITYSIFMYCSLSLFLSLLLSIFETYHHWLCFPCCTKFSIPHTWWKHQLYNFNI